ncbi:hypothetical protein [Brevundimonas aveniformis]|mgnify:CR=1 FL=1|uniref:hypothetical protein n=1 Tax=Brevundimonas aveniformis TaxID=370977 RepID=UPI002490B0FE|nr:hypothetical protein [Brevundimonas aveniformis]
MMAMMAALIVQSAAAGQAGQPPSLTEQDLCVELEGRNTATIRGERFRARALGRAVAERMPTGRPLFIRFANAGASNDVQGLTTVLSAGQQRATEIVIVETCDVSVPESTQ